VDGQPRMVFLGFGKFARADKIYALEPLTGDERGDGRRVDLPELAKRARHLLEGTARPVDPDQLF
jgi:hypothetical protein